MPSSSSDGQTLPFQAIFKGKTAASLPKASDALTEAEEAGFIFTKGGKNHWSTLEAMEEVSAFRHVTTPLTTLRGLSLSPRC